MWKLDYIRFIAVGVLNTIFGYGLFAGFILLKLDYKLATLLSTILGVLFNYKTTGQIVFRNDKSSLLRFILVYVMVYFVSISFVKVGLLMGVSALIGGAVAVFPSALTSYLLNKFWVFRRQKA